MDLCKQCDSRPSGGRAGHAPVKGLQKFPVELLHIILSFLAQTTPFRHQDFINCLHINSGSLASLCQVSKQFNQLGTPYLYHTLNPDPESFDKLARTFLGRSDLASLVRQFQIGLRVVGDIHEEYKLGPSFPILKFYFRSASETEREEINGHILNIFWHIVNVEVLDIASCTLWHMVLPVDSHNRLRELRLQAITQLDVDEELLQFIQEAPRLTRLSVNSSLHFEPDVSISNIQHLTLYDISVGYGLLDAFTVLRACRKLKSFTLYTRRQCQGWTEAAKAMLAVLRRHRTTLRTLRIEPAFNMCLGPQRKLFSSFKKLNRLQHLSISTRFFSFENWGSQEGALSPFPGEMSQAEEYQGWGLLLSLPRTIRTLDILLEHDNVHPDIPWVIAQACPTGEYPNLESLTLRIPRSCGPYLVDVSSVAEACAQMDLAFTTTHVPRPCDPPCCERCTCEDYLDEDSGADTPPSDPGSEFGVVDMESDEENDSHDESANSDEASPDDTDDNDSVFTHSGAGDGESGESEPEEAPLSN